MVLRFMFTCQVNRPYPSGVEMGPIQIQHDPMLPGSLSGPRTTLAQNRLMEVGEGASVGSVSGCLRGCMLLKGWCLGVRVMRGDVVGWVVQIVVHHA